MKVVSVYIDGENISYKYWIHIDQYLKKSNLKNITTKKIYYNIQQINNEWTNIAFQYNIEQIHVDKMKVNFKNSSDIRLVVDVLSDLYEKPFITTFIIISSDTDFGHLIRKLKSCNKEVIIISNSSTNLVNFCDDFIFIKDLVSSENDVNDDTFQYYSTSDNDNELYLSTDEYEQDELFTYNNNTNINSISDKSITNEIMNYFIENDLICVKKKKLERHIIRHFKYKRTSIDLLRSNILTLLKEKNIIYDRSNKSFHTYLFAN